MMSLSCECCDYWPVGTRWWECRGELAPLATSRRRRCQSCAALIDLGADCLKFDRYRSPNSDIEVRIYGEDGAVMLHPQYLCEHCAEIWLNLDALGYCLTLGDSMPEALAEYHALTGWTPGKGPGKTEKEASAWA